MSQSKRLVYFLFGVGSFVLTACGGSNTSSIDRSLNQLLKQPAQEQQVLSPEINYFKAGFKDGKVRLSKDRKLPVRISGGVTESYLPSGTKLLALVDNRCAEQKYIETDDLSSDLYLNDSYDFLNVQAYEYKVPTNLGLNELRLAADADECTYGIAEIRQYQLEAVPNDPFYATQGYHSAGFINSATAWDWFYHPVKGIKQDVIIAVIDTGIRRTHQDLTGNIYLNAAGENGFDFINNDADPSDDNQHGSHVAGLIGAVNNNALGGSGVMGTRAKLMGVKVLNAAGSGTSLSVTNGINFAVQNGAQVINMSLGATAGPDEVIDAAYQAALQNAVAQGVTVVVAAGNSNFNMDVQSAYPANQGRNFAGLITVGSLDTSNNARSTFSNFSSTRVELFAPGCEISGSTLQGLFSLHPAADNAYTRLCGTSMATPIVAGAAALAIGMLRSNNYTPTPAQIENLLTATATVNPNLSGLGVGARSLSLLRLAEAVSNGFPNADPRRITIVTPPKDTTLKEGENVTLTVAIDTFPAGGTIQWTKNNVAIPGATGTQLAFTAVGPDQLADYRAVVSNGYNSLASAPARLNVLYKPRLVSQTASVIGIFGQSQRLDGLFNANPQPAYQWYRNGMLMAGQTAASLIFTRLDWLNQGTYMVKATNSEGTVDSAAISLTLAPIAQPIDGGIER